MKKNKRNAYIAKLIKMLRTEGPWDYTTFYIVAADLAYYYCIAGNYRTLANIALHRYLA